MKKFLIGCFIILTVISTFYAQSRPVNEWYWVNPQKGTGGSAKKELLTGIDMVTITKNPEKFEFTIDKEKNLCYNTFNQNVK